MKRCSRSNMCMEPPRPCETPSWRPKSSAMTRLGSAPRQSACPCEREPEVRAGALGAARLLGAVPVPARIVAKQPGRSWTWRVGLVEMVHRVEPAAGGGCQVAIDVIAPPPLEGAVAAAYGPVIGATLR